jgi:adenine-specific DNA-methyltransferase
MTAKDGQSKDLIAENVDKLKQLFPEIVTEGKIDFDTLKEVLGDFSDDRPERYSFTWNGKTEARKLAMTPSKGTLRPAPEESVNWDTTQNLFIEGDNLEVLKLLQRSYHKKIKMIYIDPPYNTGNDFVYNDDFKDNLSNYLKLTGQKDGEGNKITSNPETSGRYHTDWLNMMYPRLKLARELLRDDGVIFVSIDDNEVTNLRKLCDEVFGEENFIASICHKSRASVSNDKIISSNHNHILLYAKDYELIHENRWMFGLKPDPSGFNKEDEKGKYKLVPVDGPGGASKGNPYYNFMGVEGYFRFSKETMKKKYDQGLIVKRENSLQQKYYLEDYLKSRKTDTTWWDEKLYTSSATRELKKLMNGDFFDSPKPVQLIKKMLELHVRDNDDIVLDFFAGSATTGHAIYEQNKKDGINRNFILIQLPERIEDKEALKRGYKSISDVSKDRLKKALESIDSKDGFKVFELDASNIKPWDPTFEDVQLSIEDSIENIKNDRSEEDVIYEILLKYGLDLTLPIEEKNIAGAKVFVGGAGALILCLSDNITTEVVEGIAKLKDELNPEFMRVVFRDSGFKDDVIKTNAVQILKQQGIEDMRSI